MFDHFLMWIQFFTSYDIALRSYFDGKRLYNNHSRSLFSTGVFTEIIISYNFKTNVG